MIRKKIALALSFVLLGSFSLLAADHHDENQIQHVLLISVDGLHALDVQRYIESQPTPPSPNLPGAV